MSIFTEMQHAKESSLKDRNEQLTCIMVDDIKAFGKAIQKAFGIPKDEVVDEPILSVMDVPVFENPTCSDGCAYLCFGDYFKHGDASSWPMTSLAAFDMKYSIKVVRYRCCYCAGTGIESFFTGPDRACKYCEGTGVNSYA